MGRIHPILLLFPFLWQTGDGTRSFLHAAAFSPAPSLLPFPQALHGHPRSIIRHVASHSCRVPPPPLAVQMGLKLQSEQKEALKHSRWWDPIWRWEQIEQLKDPEKQFDKEALEMAAMLGIEVEEYVRSMSGTAKVSLSSSAYDAMLVMCVRAAQSGDLLGMVHAKEVLSKMEQVGISPDVDLYNQVLSACSAAAGGVMRPCPVRNDTEERRDFIDMAVKVVSYSGGKVDSTEFASRWRTMFPNASIHNYTYTDGKKQSTWKALAQSARFEVEDGEEGKKVIVLRRKDGKDRKKSTTTISSSSSSSSSSSRNPWIQVGLDFLGSMRRNKVEPNEQTYNILISMCARAAKEGDDEMIDQSFRLFDEMKKRGLPVNQQTLNALINVCAKSNNLDRMREVEKEYETGSFTPDVFVFSARMKAARSCQGVMEVLEEMKKFGVSPNLASLNTALVAIHSLQGGGEGLKCARVVMEQMSSLNLQPDASTYTTFLSIMAGAAKKEEDGEKFAKEAIEMFGSIKKSKAVKLDVRMYTTVFHALIGIGLQKHVFNEEMRGANMSKFALKHLMSMKQDQVSPDRRAFHACLSAMALAAKLGGKETIGHVNEVWKMMEKSRTPFDLACYKTLMEAYSNAICARNGSVYVLEAEKVLDRMRTGGRMPDFQSYMTVLKAYENSAVRGGKVVDYHRRALGLVVRMQREMVKPTTQVFNAIIAISGSAREPSGWRHRKRNRRLERGFQVYDMMCEKQIQPDEETFANLLQCALTTAEVKIIEKLMEKAGVEKTGVICTSCIDTLSRNPIQEDIEHVSQTIEEARKKNIVTSNMMMAVFDFYKAARMSEEALKFLQQAKEDKIPLNKFVLSAALKAAVRARDKEASETIITDLETNHQPLGDLVRAQIDHVRKVFST
uniref:PROP1-like PPR domain-containing protein n=1 Tax=Guillardia theta TaxID=55529 RepID=A0A7S4UPA5_GUITH